jgi:hypothetical protein
MDMRKKCIKNPKKNKKIINKKMEKLRLKFLIKFEIFKTKLI